MSRIRQYVTSMRLGASKLGILLVIGAADLQNKIACAEQCESASHRGAQPMTAATQDRNDQASFDIVLKLVRAETENHAALAAITRTIGRTTAVGEMAATELTTLLKANRPGVRLAAAVALEALDRRDKVVVAGLIAALSDDNLKVRHQVEATLTRFEIVRNPNILTFIIDLKHPDEAVRYRAALYLGKFTKRAEIARNALAQLAKDETCHVAVRWEAIYSLHAIGPSAVSDLIDVARHSDASVRQKAVAALAHLGQESIPALIAWLKHDEYQVRRAAAFALGTLGSDAEKVEQALQGALVDPDRDVRNAAEEALQTIRQSTREQR